MPRSSPPLCATPTLQPPVFHRCALPPAAPPPRAASGARHAAVRLLQHQRFIGSSTSWSRSGRSHSGLPGCSGSPDYLGTCLMPPDAGDLVGTRPRRVGTMTWSRKICRAFCFAFSCTRAVLDPHPAAAPSLEGDALQSANQPTHGVRMSHTGATTHTMIPSPHNTPTQVPEYSVQTAVTRSAALLETRVGCRFRSVRFRRMRLHV